MGAERERPVVLDTSALLTLIEDEPGADRVERALAEERTLLPALALVETYYVSLQERGTAVAAERHALLRQLPSEVVWELDETVVLTAGRFKASHRLSLADACIAAIAAREDAVLLHKDPELEAVAGEVRLEALPYKS